MLKSMLKYTLHTSSEKSVVCVEMGVNDCDVVDGSTPRERRDVVGGAPGTPTSLSEPSTPMAATSSRFAG